MPIEQNQRKLLAAEQEEQMMSGEDHISKPIRKLMQKREDLLVMIEKLDEDILGNHSGSGILIGLISRTKFPYDHAVFEQHYQEVKKYLEELKSLRKQIKDLSKGLCGESIDTLYTTDYMQAKVFFLFEKMKAATVCFQILRHLDCLEVEEILEEKALLTDQFKEKLKAQFPSAHDYDIKDAILGYIEHKKAQRCVELQCKFCSFLLWSYRFIDVNDFEKELEHIKSNPEFVQQNLGELPSWILESELSDIKFLMSHGRYSVEDKVAYEKSQKEMLGLGREESGYWWVSDTVYQMIRLVFRAEEKSMGVYFDGDPEDGILGIKALFWEIMYKKHRELDTLKVRQSQKNAKGKGVLRMKGQTSNPASAGIGSAASAN